MRPLLIILLMLSTGSALAAQSVEAVRFWAAPDSTRVVLDLSGPIDHNVLRLAHPPRLVVDLNQTDLRIALPQPDAADAMLSAIRSGVQDGGSTLRLVFDLKREARAKTMLLPPAQQYGHRLVLDLSDATAASAPASAPAPAVTPLPAPSAPGPRRDLVIAIDAGHGGEDPGAIGYRGTREKDVVLAITRRLEELVQSEPGMRAVLTRKGDYFLSLKERREMARRAQADLFISVHADAYKNRAARGSSVFVLSERGASNEFARLLAEQENASDLIGGVSLEDKDDLVKSVLLDLSQTGTILASLQVGGAVLEALGGVNTLHKSHVEQAGFMVLKAPDVPSILVETAFISNPLEERKLNSPREQDAMARAILTGVRDYFKRRGAADGPAQTAGEHIIRAGETLFSIARHYGLRPHDLRSANAIAGDQLLVGSVLRIPGAESIASN